MLQNKVRDRNKAAFAAARIFLTSLILSQYGLLGVLVHGAHAENSSEHIAKHRILIDRASKQLELFQNDQLVLRSRIGIGKGGLRQKKDMADNVTPSGKFVVEIVLSNDLEANSTARSLLARYKNNADALAYLSSKSGLERLFTNMNSLDFDRDGRSDTAYGIAYIGLTPAPSQNPLPVTGPKFSLFEGKDYWFSIALHGTNNENQNIGHANSGGCIHLPKKVLQQILSQKLVSIGDSVTIK